jgi:hypothetical protein
MMAANARPHRATKMNWLGRSIVVVHVLFFAPFASAAENGMTLFETDPTNRHRLSTRYPSRYFAMTRDFARDSRLGGSYGDAVLTKSGDGRRKEPHIQ